MKIKVLALDLDSIFSRELLQLAEDCKGSSAQRLVRFGVC